MNTKPEPQQQIIGAGAGIGRRAMWLRRSPRWLVLGVMMIALPKCIACVLAYVAAFFAIGSAAVEWCGK